MNSQVEEISLNYEGRIVIGRKLTVSSQIPISIKRAWNEVLKSSILEKKLSRVYLGTGSLLHQKGVCPIDWKNTDCPIVYSDLGQN